MFFKIVVPMPDKIWGGSILDFSLLAWLPILGILLSLSNDHWFSIVSSSVYSQLLSCEEKEWWKKYDYKI